MVAVVALLVLTAGLATASYQLTGTLRNEYISGKTVEGALVEDSTIRDSTVKRATVRDSTLDGVTIEKATVERARIDDATIRDTTVRDSTIEDARLHGVTVQRSNLVDTRVEKALVEGGSLRDSTVVDSTLDNVDLTRVSLCRVLLRDENRHVNTGCPGGGGGGGGGAPPPHGGGRLVLERGGAGPNYDWAYPRGKFFPNADSGRVREVCVYASGAGRTVDFAVKERPDGSSPQFTDSVYVASNTPSWVCKSMSEPFYGNSLFIYRTGGSASVGWQRDSYGDSYASFNSGATWVAEPQYSRGYRVVIDR